MKWIDSLVSIFSIVPERKGMFEMDWTHQRYMNSKDSMEDPVEAKRKAEERFQNYIQVLKENGLAIDEKFEEKERKCFLRECSTRELDEQLEMLLGHPKPVLIKLLEKMRNVSISKEDMEVTDLV